MMSTLMKLLSREQKNSLKPKEGITHKKTAHLAKERLQVIVAHERGQRTNKQPDYLPALQRDLLETISRYVKINPEHVKVHVESQGTLDVLELKIDLPED